jgi:hypothetical protein
MYDWVDKMTELCYAIPWSQIVEVDEIDWRLHPNRTVMRVEIALN